MNVRFISLMHADRGAVLRIQDEEGRCFEFVLSADQLGLLLQQLAQVLWFGFRFIRR
jgi:hypothetical protein